MYSKWCLTKVQMRRSSVAKFGLLVTLMTFCAMKVIIVEDIQEWTIHTPRDVSLYISPSENTTVLYPRIMAQKFKKKLDFLIVVTSDPSHFERREAIRQTWGSSHNQDSPLRIGLIFLMGLTLNAQVRLGLVTSVFCVFGNIFIFFRVPLHFFVQ